MSPSSALRHTSRNIERKFVELSGSGSCTVASGREDMILSGHEDLCNCVDPQNLGKSE